MTLQWAKKHCQACFRSAGANWARAPRGPGGICRSEPSDFLDVGGLETLGTASDVELDAVTLDQGLEALGLDGVEWTNTSSPPSCVMNPYPLASLNHFTRPFAMLPYLVPFFGATPLDAPRTELGRLPRRKANKNAARTGSPRGVSFGPYGIADIQCEPEPEKRLHGPLVSRQSSCSARVTGCDPFFVPSQPGMAMENRPAVPPATTT